jgi:hypothetical protein
MGFVVFSRQIVHTIAIRKFKVYLVDACSSSASGVNVNR